MRLIASRWFAAPSCLLLATLTLAQGPDRWSQARIDLFVADCKARTLQAAEQQHIQLPEDFLSWVDADPLRMASVYGCRKDALPVLLGLRSLEIELGAATVRTNYEQLALAFAMQGSYAPYGKAAGSWNDGDEAAKNLPLPDVTPRAALQLVVPGDPRVLVDTKASGRPLDRDDHIINFLQDHVPVPAETIVTELPPLEYDDKGIAKPQGKAKRVKKTILRAPVGADVIASSALQQEFNAYMAAHGHADVKIDCGERSVHWFASEAVQDGPLRKAIAAAHELFHTAYRNKGLMPKERDAAPSAAESMQWFVRNASSTPKHQWPLFPLNAPWPLLLMLVNDNQPLREREDIWQKFHDEGEMRTYGEYIGGIAQQFDMQSARRVAPIAFNYGSIQMMWKDGGVCGTMGNIGARTYRICGVPASTAGQPGHCALVHMAYDSKTGQYQCRGGQYATGGDEVTTVHAGWNYDDVGGRKPMVFHQSVAWGCNQSVREYVSCLVLRRMWDRETKELRAAAAPDFVRVAMRKNAFALPCVLGAIDACETPELATLLLDAAVAELNQTCKEAEYPLYRSTLRDLVHARIAALPKPETPAANQKLLDDLERQGCEHAALLARTWRAIGGEAAFNSGTKQAALAYLAAAERVKNRRLGQQVEKRVVAWEKSIKGREAKQQWAKELLALFAGQESFKVRGKAIADPVVERLRKLAGS